MDEGIPATFGEAVIAEIHRHRADVALLSPVGLHPRYGATSFDHREAEVARAMVGNADRVILLADHSKIGQASRVSFCPLDGIETLVTDAVSETVEGFAAIAGRLRNLVVG